MSESYSPADAFGLIRSYIRHRDYVRAAIGEVSGALERRALVHDLSKMLDDEFSGFARINAAARVNKFGSPEYSAAMETEREVIDTHFARNSHHAEYHAMTFLDVIEMVCDWRGAQQGYDDPRPWLDTVELNFKAKGKYLTPEQLWLAREVATFLANGDKTYPTPKGGARE